MKKWTYITLVFSIIFISFSNIDSSTQKITFTLVEEGRSFWNQILDDEKIMNKNLLYASYIAYKDRLNDLSIETFQECMYSNPSNSIIVGISNYYIGKNYYLIGKYKRAITQFANVNNIDMAKYNYIKYAALINTALSYYQLNNIEKFRENLQKVINDDRNGKYKKIALDFLAKLNK